MIDRRIDLVALRNISDKSRHFTTQRLHLFRHGFKVGGVHIHQHQRRPLFRKAKRNPTSNSLACAGYQRHFIINCHAFSLMV